MSRTAGVVVALGPLVLLMGLTGACSPAGVTGPALEESLSTTYAQLYVRQQRLQGHPPVTARALSARAGCDKGGPSVADTGAGDDWQCLVVWLVDGPGTPARAHYHLEVHADGSYVADGEGPRPVNEQHTLTGVHGTQVTNPLWQFDGWVDPTSTSPTTRTASADPVQQHLDLSEEPDARRT